MKVVAYLKHNVTKEFEAKNLDNAREIAKRIITEGLWDVEPSGEETFYPITEIFKARIIRE